MENYKKLNIARGIFTFIIFVIFGIIICTEKGGDYLIPKVNKKLNEYLTTNYSNIINDVSKYALIWFNLYVYIKKQLIKIENSQ